MNISIPTAILTSIYAYRLVCLWVPSAGVSIDWCAVGCCAGGWCYIIGAKSRVRRRGWGVVGVESVGVKSLV